MKSVLAVAAAAALAVAAGAAGAGEAFHFTARLAGVPRLHASFGATLTGGTLAWKLTSPARGTAAELAGLGRSVTLCKPCTATAKGTLAVAPAQIQLLQHGKATVRLHTAKGVLTGKLKLIATVGAGSGSATPTPISSGPAGTTWTATAAALRGQNGNRFEFSCPPNASAGAGPVWGGGGDGSFADTSAVCPAAVMTGDILLQGGGLVIIEIRAGEPSYTGTTSNGVTSQSLGPSPGSFVVIHDS
jgi:LCCL domain-containing protein